MRSAILFLLTATLALTLGCRDGDGDDAPEPEPTSAATVSPGATSSASTPAAADPTADGALILATSSTVQDSGLIDVLVPMFEQETGYAVEVVTAEPALAIEQAARGDADAVLADAPEAEKSMVADGDGVERILVMHGDFAFVGPAGDPAGVQGVETAEDAVAAVADTASPFVSRGDDSGTHAAEMRVWKAAEIDPVGQPWYTVTDQRMDATLQVANQQQAYTVSDRATFRALGGDLDLEILSAGDPNLLNYYHVIVVNPEKHPDVNAAGAQAFADFLVREDIQTLIREFGVEEFGEPLFVPEAGNADPTALSSPSEPTRQPASA